MDDQNLFESSDTKFDSSKRIGMRIKKGGGGGGGKMKRGMIIITYSVLVIFYLRCEFI